MLSRASPLRSRASVAGLPGGRVEEEVLLLVGAEVAVLLELCRSYVSAIPPFGRADWRTYGDVLEVGAALPLLFFPNCVPRTPPRTAPTTTSARTAASAKNVLRWRPRMRPCAGGAGSGAPRSMLFSLTELAANRIPLAVERNTGSQAMPTLTTDGGRLLVRVESLVFLDGDLRQIAVVRHSFRVDMIAVVHLEARVVVALVRGFDCAHHLVLLSGEGVCDGTKGRGLRQ